MANRDSYKEGTPSWVELATTDVPGAKSFYSKLLGWEFVENAIDDSDDTYTMAMRGDRALAGMMQQQTEQVEMGLPPLWNTYISVDDVDATVGKIEAAGGGVMAPAFDIMEVGRMAVVVDPAGAVVCLWQAGLHPGSQIVNEPGAFTWAELQTTDQAAASAFFGEVFGWESGSIDMGPIGSITTFKVDGEDVASAMDVPMEGVPPHWQVYFGVDDCDASCATATAGGGTVLAPPMDAPPGRMATLMDPAGGVFSIIALNEQHG